ncbi:hypothetical protein GEMRC1_005744 [Eukaryota sp. GEM-RC1]
MFFRTFVSGCLSTLLGGLISVFLGRNLRSQQLAICFAFTSGVMLHIGVFDLFQSAAIDIGSVPAHLAFFTGILLFSLLVFIVPEPSLASSSSTKDKPRAAIFKTAFFVFFSISLHNVPEGLVVSTSYSFTRMMAIIVHNVIEGLAMGLPLMSAGVSKTKVLFFSFLSGFSETLGGMLPLLFTPSDVVLSYVHAGLGGVMLLTSLMLLPEAFIRAHSGIILFFVFLGMSLSSICFCLES